MAKTQQPIELRHGKPCYAVNSVGQAICGKPHKETGALCHKRPVMPDGRCKNHSGIHRTTVPSKALEGDVKNRKIRFLPHRLMALAEEAMNDPDLLESKEDLAILDSFMTDAISSLDDQEQKDAWKKLQDLAKEYEKNPNLNPVWCCEQMVQQIKIGCNFAKTQAQIESLIALRTKVVDSEVKRQEKTATNLSVREAVIFAGEILNVLKEELSAHPVLFQRIATRINILFGGATQQGAGKDSGGDRGGSERAAISPA